MLEAYEAYGDYNTIGTLTRELIQAAAVAGLGTTVLRRADGAEYDIAGEWPSKTVHGAVSEALGEEVTPDTSEERLRELCAQADVPTEPGWRRGPDRCWRCTSGWWSGRPWSRRSTGTSRSRSRR